MTQGELLMAAEYDRGYHDGKAAYDADQWQVRHDRMEAANKLRGLTLNMGSHENLAAICECIYEPAVNWSCGACEMLRMRLLHLLDDAEVVSDYHYHYEPPTPRDLTYEALLDLLRDAARDYKMRVAEIELKNAVLDIAIDMNKDMRRKLEGYEESHIELPKDMDGEYIHIGDRVEDNEKVARIVLTDSSWEPSVYVYKLPNVLHEYFCNEIGHYKEPDTAESIVRDLTLGNISESDAIARIEKLGSQHE